MFDTLHAGGNTGMYSIFDGHCHGLRSQQDEHLRYAFAMDAKAFRWADVEPDNPIALLTRRSVSGDNLLAAKVQLAKGCCVKLHRHASEQLAIVVSGRVLWTIGEEGSDEQTLREMVGGEVLLLPSNVWHGVEALEDTEIIDVLSPPGAMGVDSQLE